MADVKWSDHAMACMKEQAKYIAEQSQSKEIDWKWAVGVRWLDGRCDGLVEYIPSH